MERITTFCSFNVLTWLSTIEIFLKLNQSGTSRDKPNLVILFCHYLCSCFLVIILERMCEGVRRKELGRGGERERENNLKQSPHPEHSPVWDLIWTTTRSWPKSKKNQEVDAQLTEPSRYPLFCHFNPWSIFICIITNVFPYLLQEINLKYFCFIFSLSVLILSLCWPQNLGEFLFLHYLEKSY